MECHPVVPSTTSSCDGKNVGVPAARSGQEVRTSARSTFHKTNPILGEMHAQITDRSGVTPQCTYTADNGFTRSFALNANSTSKLNIVPASPELRNWNVSVACDKGTRTDTTTFF